MHRPRPLEKVIASSAWVFGCAVTIFANIKNFRDPLLKGIIATIFFFVFAFYIEEPFLSGKKAKRAFKKAKKSTMSLAH